MLKSFSTFCANSKKIQTKGVCFQYSFGVSFLYLYWTFSILAPFLLLLSTIYMYTIKYAIFYVSFAVANKCCIYTIMYISDHVYSCVLNFFSSAIGTYFNIKRIQCTSEYSFDKKDNSFDKKSGGYELLNENNRVMYAEFPHGIFTIGFINNFFLLSGCKNVVFDALYHAPFFGDLIKVNNCIPSNKRSVDNCMKTGCGIHILPGGFHEIFLTENFRYNVYVPTGFIAMSVRHGYRIVPILNIGENETFYIFKIPNKYFGYVSNFYKKILKVPIFCAIGKFCMLIPHNVNIWSVYGTPIECNQLKDELFSDAVERIHNHENIVKYCSAYNLDINLYKINIYRN